MVLGPQQEHHGGEQEEAGEDEELGVELLLDKGLPLDVEEVDYDVLDEVEVLQLGAEHYQVEGGLGLKLPRLQSN